MGYFRHHGMLVTAWNAEQARPALEKAQSIGLTTSAAIPSPFQGWVSFAVFPDGSKEGWAESNAGDAARAAFLAWLETQRYEDGSTWLKWVEVQYGDDNGVTKVVSHSEMNQP